MLSFNNIAVITVCLVLSHSAASDGKGQCGFKIIERHKFVAGGADFERWPWMVSLGFYSKTKAWAHRCGATVISPNYVLTAAHCVYDLKRNLTLHFGDFDLESDADDDDVVEREILEIFIHPRYDDDQAYFDIAVLRVETLNFNDALQPICLPEEFTDENVFDHRHAYILGWGSYSINSDTSAKLRTGTLEIYPNDVCNSTHSNTDWASSSAVRQYLPNLFPSYLICAGDNGGSRGSCRGDSGGPLQISQLPAGNFIQIGIVSGGIGSRFCGDVAVAAVYSRVDHPENLFFIQQIIFGQREPSHIEFTGEFKLKEYIGEVQHGLPWGEGTLHYRNGDHYMGSLERGTKSGEGRMDFHTGQIYDGQWKDDHFSGFGTLSFAQDDLREKYVGHFENGVASGHGNMTWKNGDFYDGEWLNDLMNGKGMIRYSPEQECNRASYTGDFKDGQLTGHGLVKWNNGDEHDGEWINGKENGFGTTKYNDDDQYDRKSYAGEWKDSTWHGKGVLTFNEESSKVSYTGSFRKDFFYGHGVMVYRSGAVYDGNWLFNDYNGNGTLTFAPDDKLNRTKYVGEYQTGKFHGYGVITYTDDDNRLKYEGQFVNGLFSGHGAMTYRNGAVYDGDWFSDDFEGNGTLTFGPNDKFNREKHIGEYHMGKFHGQGTITYADNDTRLKYEGQFKEGLFSGYGVMTYRNGDVYDGPWENDARNGFGIFIYASENDKKSFTGEFKDDKFPMHGTITWKSGNVETI